MNRLKKIFEKFNDKYKQKKSHFEKVVSQWGERGYKSWHSKGEKLLEVLDTESKQIGNFFNSSEKIEKRDLKNKINLFKKTYKELNEIVKPSWRQWVEALVVAGAVAFVLRSFLFGLYHVPTGSAEPTILVGDRVWGNKLAYVWSKPQRGDLIIFDEPNFKYSSNAIQYYWQKYVGFPVPLFGLGSGPKNLTKRLIAVPGDWIEGRLEEGKPVIYLNSEKLDEPYINPYPLIWLNKKTGFLPFDFFGPLSFLSKKSVPMGFRCTYVPDKSFEDQPYYQMDKSEIVRIPGISYLTKPFTPSYKGYDSDSCADVFGPIRLPEGKYWAMGDSRKNSEDCRWFGYFDESLIHGRISFIIYSIDSLEPFWLFEMIKHPIDFWFKSVRWNRFFSSPKHAGENK